MLALLIVFAVIVALLVAFWQTLRGQSRRGLDPTLAEHAAADAARVGSTGAVGSHDATTTGPPGFLDEAVIRDRNGLEVR